MKKIKQISYVSGLIVALFSCISTAQASSEAGQCEFGINGQSQKIIDQNPNDYLLLNKICKDGGCVLGWGIDEEHKSLTLHFSADTEYKTTKFTVNNNKLLTFADAETDNSKQFTIKREDDLNSYVITYNSLVLTISGQCVNNTHQYHNK
jgi:hypothetical protein